MSKISEEMKTTLIERALKARDTSYSPYSKFRVGAALLADNGEIIDGSNIENASYGATICAERTAAVKAASQGIRRFKAIAVATDLQETCSPCGICRQFLREFTPLDAPIYMTDSRWKKDAVNPAEYVLEVTLEDLLPHSFGPEHLDKERSA